MGFLLRLRDVLLLKKPPRCYQHRSGSGARQCYQHR
nr:MAG TPA: hypothetical protein [Caudoviricetes sp.]